MNVYEKFQRIDKGCANFGGVSSVRGPMDMQFTKNQHFEKQQTEYLDF